MSLSATKYTIAAVKNHAITSSTTPPFIISVILMYPVPYTKAFGGVATGSINAIDAARVAATDNATGSFPVPCAIEIIIGIIIDVTAVLDVTSVRSSRRMIKTNINTNVEGEPKNESAVFANQLARPVLNIPSDSAMPPPNNKRVPQSTNFASDQLSTNFWLFQSTGSRNNIRTPNKAIIFSSNHLRFSER